MLVLPPKSAIANVGESKKVDLDSSFHAVDFGFKKIKESNLNLPVEVVFWIPIVSGIPDSLSCISSKPAFPRLLTDLRYITCVQITAPVKVVVVDFVFFLFFFLSFISPFFSVLV